MRYLAAAERTGDWLLATAERSPEGWFWPLQPGVSAEVEPGLGWGTAGPVLFFVEAFRTTGDERWLSAARAGVRWMDAHLDTAVTAWAGVMLTLGADYLGPAAVDLATRAGDWLLAQAEAAPTGIRWSLGRAYEVEFRLPQPALPPETTYMQGAPGIGSTLLHLHRHLAGDPWTVRWPHAPDWTEPGGGR